MIKYFIFVWTFCISHSGIKAQGSCSVDKCNFQQGEKLTYIVSYNWFVIWTEVGEVTFSVDKSNIGEFPTYHLLGVGQTYPGWDIFFKVRDRYESWVNPETLQPIYFKRRVREGGYEIDINYLFNHKRNYALSSYIVNKEPRVKDTIPITGCTFDIMSVLYYARTLDYSKFNLNQTIPFTILLDRKLENVYFRYLGTEHIKVKHLGEFECIKLTIMVIAGSVFKGGETMTLWITNDQNKIPVYLESPIIIGSVKVRLDSYNNILYPLKQISK